MTTTHPVPTITTAGSTVAALCRWIDDHPANVARDPEAATWGRLAKVAEESGEVIAAYIAATGQNPRKGVHGTLDDVRKELLDVALTALCAVVEHLDDANGQSMAALLRHIEATRVRAGVVALTPSGDLAAIDPVATVLQRLHTQVCAALGANSAREKQAEADGRQGDALLNAARVEAFDWVLQRIDEEMEQVDGAPCGFETVTECAAYAASGIAK